MASLSQRHCFLLFGKISPCDFSNHDFIVTEQKEVAYVKAGVTLEGLKTEEVL
jgi:hypothetical protein